MSIKLRRQEECKQKLQIRRPAEKMKHCLIFRHEIFYVTIVLFKYWPSDMALLLNLVVWNIVPVSALYRMYRGRQFWKWLVILN